MELPKNPIIVWSKVNPIVVQALEFLSSKYKKEVEAFLTWYQQKVGSTTSLYTPEMRTWVIQGIPKVKTIINLLGKELDLIDSRLDRIFTSSATQEQIRIQSRAYREGKADLDRLLVAFLGCREGLGAWYIGMLNLLALRFPSLPIFRNTIPYFEDVCFKSQHRLLRIQSNT